ncbi:MAG: TolC family protein [Cytophagales bacterium]|nr:TolC family protein [Cytophagales bacterium]
MNSTKYLFIIVMSFVLSATSVAQDSLSLSQAIEVGLARNFQIQISNQNLEIAQNNNSWGEAGAYPIVNFRLVQGNRWLDQNNPTSFVNGSFYSGNVSPNVDVSWVLFQGFRVRINKQRLSELEAQSAGNVQLIIENTIQAISLAYYRCIVEQQKLEIVEKTLSLSRDRWQYIQEKKDLGIASTFEVLQEKNAYLGDSLNLSTQTFNVQGALRNLNLLLASEDINQAYLFPNSLTLPNQNYSWEAIKTQLTESNQSLKNQYINLSLLKQNTALQKSALYPSINLNVGSNYSASQFARDGESINGSSQDFYANFTLNFTLFNGGKIKRAIQNAKTQEQIANLQKDELVLNITHELRNAFERYQLQQQQYQIQKTTQASTKLQLEMAEDRFKNGLINSFDFRIIQLNYLNTELQLLEQSFQVLNTNTNITRLIGGYIQEK